MSSVSTLEMASGLSPSIQSVIRAVHYVFQSRRQYLDQISDDIKGAEKYLQEQCLSESEFVLTSADDTWTEDKSEKHVYWRWCQGLAFARLESGKLRIMHVIGNQRGMTPLRYRNVDNIDLTYAGPIIPNCTLSTLKGVEIEPLIEATIWVRRTLHKFLPSLIVRAAQAASHDVDCEKLDVRFDLPQPEYMIPF